MRNATSIAYFSGNLTQSNPCAKLPKTLYARTTKTVEKAPVSNTK